MDVLAEFPHGLGDATQFTCVLQHLVKHRPDWEIDVASRLGKHTAFFGHCRRSLVLDRDAIDRGRYRWVYDLGWYECYSVYCDSPCTKVCNTLREVFGITPELPLLKYRIEIGDASRGKTGEYLSAMCGSPTNGGPFPVVAVHYQANTSAWKKDLPHPLVANLCRELILHGFTPLILDWDRRSPLPDQKTVFCPGVGPGDLWGNIGTGDAERLAALLSQCAMVIGVDSGPLHVAGATETPTLGVWTGHSPVQFYDLCPNVTHLVPREWRSIPPCQDRPAAQFFEEHYAFREYADLERTLIGTTLDMLKVGPACRAGPRNCCRRNLDFTLGHARQARPTTMETPMTMTAAAVTWELLPGLAQEISVGADGSAWCLSPAEISPSGHSIHRWNGATWDHVDGAAVKIAVGPDGLPWVLNRDYQIFRRSAEAWELMPGLAREIAVGANGAVWCLSPANFAPGGVSIHVWTGVTWDHVEGAAMKIAVGPDGQPWVVNSAGQIFRRSGEGWELLPGLAHEIAIGGDGSVWCLGMGEMPGGGYSIHLWNGSDWDHIPGAAVKIAAGPEGVVWLVNAEHLIYRST